MDVSEIKMNLEKAVSLIMKDNTLDALYFLDKINDHTDNPDMLSGYGMCIALERGKVTDGIDLCLKAIAHDPENVFHYLNLGKIYLKDRKRAVAIDIFRKGLRLRVNNEHTSEINAILERLGTRKRPVFPFLKRSHFLNRYIGYILTKIGFR
ncbi:hypothetical protein BMS3Abin07_00671 [bacterium BMS3Abin07]|nr:hypothetical protein BMS3Abin07_00671 [bacterium BMS3Abin07]GBE32908.1 hypothetical protein BMS3Bbin05_01836 [bacterium BMS3Bbin05]HDO23192.1 tetratricopeptide repeat protein [Nitrospirota bacterium]HDZ88940.1 tetratricopeptide repeat protein [Nitrospirota bacterium]